MPQRSAPYDDTEEPLNFSSPQVLIPFLIVTLIWGSTWIVIKDQLGVVPPSWSVTYRFLLGGLVMLGVAVVTRVPIRLGREGQLFAAALGLAQFVFNFNFVYRAEHLHHIWVGGGGVRAALRAQCRDGADVPRP